MEEIGSKSSFKCTFCKKTFSRIFNLKRHVKNVHAPAYSIFKEVFKEEESFKDSFCLRLSQLRLPQSEREAKSNFVRSTLKEGEIFKEFIDFSEFLIWKEQQERETSSMYVKQRGNAIKKNGDEVLRYYCHRSGVYKPRGKGLKRLKSQGSSKIGASCPARMIVNITSGSVIVHFFKKHEIHELGVEHLRLPQSEREAVAGKLKESVSDNRILDDIRNGIKINNGRKYLLKTKISKISKEILIVQF